MTNEKHYDKSVKYSKTLQIPQLEYDKEAKLLEEELNKIPKELTTIRQFVEKEIKTLRSGLKFYNEFIEVHHNDMMRYILRVSIPAEKYPQYNFLGKLFGPGGNNLKSISLNSGCKVHVLGKGSTRNKEKEIELSNEGGGHAHFNGPLHVLLESNSNAAEDAYYQFAIALSEIRGCLDPSNNEDISGQMNDLQPPFIKSIPPSKNFRQPILPQSRQSNDDGMHDYESSYIRGSLNRRQSFRGSRIRGNRGFLHRVAGNERDFHLPMKPPPMPQSGLSVSGFGSKKSLTAKIEDLDRSYQTMEDGFSNSTYQEFDETYNENPSDDYESEQISYSSPTYSDEHYKKNQLEYNTENEYGLPYGYENRSSFKNQNDYDIKLSKSIRERRGSIRQEPYTMRGLGLSGRGMGGVYRHR